LGGSTFGLFSCSSEKKGEKSSVEPVPNTPQILAWGGNGRGLKEGKKEY